MQCKFVVLILFHTLIMLVMCSIFFIIFHTVFILWGLGAAPRPKMAVGQALGRRSPPTRLLEDPPSGSLVIVGLKADLIRLYYS